MAKKLTEWKTANPETGIKCRFVEISENEFTEILISKDLSYETYKVLKYDEELQVICRDSKRKVAAKYESGKYYRIEYK
jgi:phosphoenolpyruvate synthase/pyruvate phosphate dikinase